MERSASKIGLKNSAQRERVFVIDDDSRVRELLRIVLEANGFQVDTYESAVEFLSGSGAAFAGCLLTDLQMRDMNGLELQKELWRRGAHLAIVVMAGSGTVALAVEAMRAGAIDFLEKPFGEAELVRSVRRALEFVSVAAASASLVEQARSRIASLTRREKDVFDLVVGGNSNKTAARVLHISPRTVEIHRARAIVKLGAKNLAELVRMSIAGANVRPTA